MRMKNSSYWKINNFSSFRSFVGMILARISTVFLTRDYLSGLFWICSFQVDEILGGTL